MSRPHVSVRRVTPAMYDDFAALWVEARVEAGLSEESATRAAAAERLGSVLGREDVRAYIASADQVPVGYAVLSHSPLSGLSDLPCVVVDQLYVTQGRRRHGAARAMLAAVAAYADRLGCEQIASNVPAQGREANRFFARLGFTSLVVKRVTTTAALQRRLAGEDPRHGFDQVLQRRRSLRARATRAREHLVRS